MNECYGKNYIHNGELQPAEFFDNSLVYEGNSIYEVIRMLKGKPVFFPDHMERLESSVKLQKKRHLADIKDLKKGIIQLTRSDKQRDTNIKIVFNYNKGVDNYLIYQIKPMFPTEEQYKKGVKGLLFFAERHEPESKVINHKLRSSIYHQLIHEGAYEALLVNENNCITEGSRSNIFFIKDDVLITAPDKLVLNGITRKHIIEICRENKIDIDLSCVKHSDISKYETVFMTGTSPVVLPFHSVNNVLFNVKNPLIEKLRNLFLLKADDSTKLFKL